MGWTHTEGIPMWVGKGEPPGEDPTPTPLAPAHLARPVGCGTFHTPLRAAIGLAFSNMDLHYCQRVIPLPSGGYCPLGEYDPHREWA